MHPATEESVRAALPKTWHAFFARFGRLTHVQRVAVPRIVAGLPTLVCAPTASGKTEAVIAPLAERLLQRRGETAGAGAGELSLGLILVSPTRALCNDLERRLRGPLERTSLRLEKKSGDSPTIAWESNPEVLITTPESLDSLLCRHPARLAGLQAIVLDEVHLLDGTARGDQVRCLLERLRRIAPALQACGASATLPDSAATALRYLGEGAAATTSAGPDPSGQRPIVAEVVIGPNMATTADIVRRVFREARRRKLLVFANRRRDTEELGALLATDPRLAGHVYVHHGSLARAERLRAEQRFRDDPSAICVATSTLEIGVDIGDVDRVVLLGPPPDVSALLQRVGRGNRREARSHVICVVMHSWDKHRVEHLLACAYEGRLFPDEIPFRPDIASQQAVSLVFQSPGRWVSADVLAARLPVEVRATLGARGCESLLRGLVAGGLLRATDGGRYVAEPDAVRLFERGTLHSTIVDNHEVEVVDETTGRVVGTARFDQRAREAAAKGAPITLALGGRRRTARRLADDRVVVSSETGRDDARFIASDPPRYTFGLAQDLAHFLGVEPGVIEARAADGKYVLSHFLGTVWGRVFSVWAKQKKLRGPDDRAGDAFFLTVERLPGTGVGANAVPPIGTAPDVLRELERAAQRDAKRLARLLAPGSFARYVPDSLRADWLRRALRLEALAEHLARARFVVVDDETPVEDDA
jgi:ATP-dependent Lhr-like helicase